MNSVSLGLQCYCLSQLPDVKSCKRVYIDNFHVTEGNMSYCLLRVLLNPYHFFLPGCSLAYGILSSA